MRHTASCQLSTNVASVSEHVYSSPVAVTSIQLALRKPMQVQILAGTQIFFLSKTTTSGSFNCPSLLEFEHLFHQSSKRVYNAYTNQSMLTRTNQLSIISRSVASTRVSFNPIVRTLPHSLFTASTVQVIDVDRQIPFSVN